MTLSKTLWVLLRKTQKIGKKQKRWSNNKASWKKKKTEFVDPISDIQNFLGERRQIPVWSIESFDGTCIQFDGDGNTYFKTLSTGEYFEKMKTHFTDLIEELKSTGSSWKIKLIAKVVCKYDRDDRKVKTKIFIHSIKETAIMLGTDFDIFDHDIIKSFMK